VGLDALTLGLTCVRLAGRRWLSKRTFRIYLILYCFLPFTLESGILPQRFHERAVLLDHPSAIPQPGRIRAARDLRGLTQSQVVAEMARPITAAALSQIEGGRVRPTPSTLQDLADALDVPVGFLSAQWPGGATNDVLSGVVYFRDLAATSAKERRRAGALALLLSDVLAAVEQRVRLPDLQLPHYDLDRAGSRDEVEDAAQALRGEWNLGDEPIPHVIRELERHGVVVARLQLGSRNVDAFAVTFSRRPLVLLAQDKSNYVRSRFDASHELGHLILHRHGTGDTAARLSERQAHDFAASFLLPRKLAEYELPRRIDARGWAHLADLKRRWGMSMAALLYRARDLKILSPDAYLTAIKYMSAKGWRLQEPGDREMGQPEAPSLLERAIRTVEVETNQSREAFLRLANLPVKDTLALVASAIDRRPSIEP
jgi:Zn-dependent peptidase ImmA (M78 family)/transcriptional regulator with XRE-family HTH domain